MAFKDECRSESLVFDGDSDLVPTDHGMLIASATNIFYPDPDSFQKLELSDLRAEHREQLEDISAQLLLFEASLRGKEKQLQETLDKKDQAGSNPLLKDKHVFFLPPSSL